jgi:hypothetical protein
MLEVENTITTPFQDFDLVVKPFDKVAAGSVDKVIGDLLPPMFQGLQDLIKELQPTFLPPLGQGLDFAMGNGTRDGLVQDSCQLFAQVIGLFQFRRISPQFFSTRRSSGRRSAGFLRKAHMLPFRSWYSAGGKVCLSRLSSLWRSSSAP